MVPVFTTGQRTSFHQRGIVRVRQVFSPADAAEMAACLWEFLRTSKGILREDANTWTSSWSGLGALASRPPFQRIASTRFQVVIDALLGAGRWRVPRTWNMFLVSPPDRVPQPWQVPAAGWHYDAVPARDAGLMLFLFFERVVPRGGGTLLVEGSHRLLARWSARNQAAIRSWSFAEQKRRFLASHPWLARLSGTAPRSDRGLEFLAPHRDADGTVLRVHEATGHPGDMLVCPSWIVHARPSQQERAHRVFAIKLLRPVAGRLPDDGAERMLVR